MASTAATTQSENAFSPALSVTDCARTGHQLSQQNPATTQAVAAIRNTRPSPRKRSGFVKHGQLTYKLLFYRLELFQLENKTDQRPQREEGGRESGNTTRQNRVRLKLVTD